MTVESHRADKEAREVPRRNSPIVLVEDDRDLREAMSIQLRYINGGSVASYPTGEAALEDLRRKTPGNGFPCSVVVTDLNLGGGLNGVELARMLTEERLAEHVILLTGRAGEVQDAYSEEDLAKCGVREVLDKPCPRARLLSAVANVREVKHPDA